MLSDSPGQKLKQMIKAPVEWLWACGFFMAGRIGRYPVRAWSSPGQQRILVMAPHPDDEAVGCAGTIIRHRRSGDEVWVVHITDGRQSRLRGLSPDQMARQRQQEAVLAAKALDLNRFEWFGLPEGSWTGADLRPRLQTLLSQLCPHLIYAPSRVDFHPEHYQVAHVLGTILRDTSFIMPVPLVRIYQLEVPLTPILTNLITPAATVVRERSVVLNAYASQVASIRRGLRGQHYTASFYGLKKPVEPFWQLRADQYGLLHGEDPPEQWQPFRSLRYRPFSDPLAYRQGLSERRRLVELIDNTSN